MLIVHTYYTAGMHELAKVFVESFCFHHANDHTPLFIDAIGIDDKMKEDLYYRYPIIKVKKRPYNLEAMSKRSNVPIKTLEKWREQVEHGYVTEQNRAWKLMIAGEDRVLKVYNMLREFPDEPDALIVHFDIDTLFRANINDIVDEMKGYDVGLKLRPNINPVKARITIDMMALHITPDTRHWLSDWIRTSCSMPPKQRPIGWGQTSCWIAYEAATKDKRLKALTLPLKYGLPGRNKPNDVVWCGNVHKLTKDDCAKKFGAELARAKIVEKEANHD